MYINKNYYPIDHLTGMFSSPKLIGLVGDMSSGKSGLLYFLVKELREKWNFNLFTFGLKLSIGEQKIHSLKELEEIHDSIVLLDEFPLLIPAAEDRRLTAELQKTLQQTYHRNNCVVFCGLPRNFNKYFSCQLRAVIYKRCSIDSFVNGSDVKKIALRYGGDELGSAMLNVENDEALLYDGQHYKLMRVPYVAEFDTKKDNAPILVDKNVRHPVQ